MDFEEDSLECLEGLNMHFLCLSDFDFSVDCWNIFGERYKELFRTKILCLEPSDFLSDVQHIYPCTTLEKLTFYFRKFGVENPESDPEKDEPKITKRTSFCNISLSDCVMLKEM